MLPSPKPVRRVEYTRRAKVASHATIVVCATCQGGRGREGCSYRLSCHVVAGSVDITAGRGGGGGAVGASGKVVPVSHSSVIGMYFTRDEERLLLLSAGLKWRELQSVSLSSRLSLDTVEKCSRDRLVFAALRALLSHRHKSSASTSTDRHPWVSRDGASARRFGVCRSVVKRLAGSSRKAATSFICMFVCLCCLFATRVESAETGGERYTYIYCANFTHLM